MDMDEVERVEENLTTVFLLIVSVTTEMSMGVELDDFGNSTLCDSKS